MRRELMVPLAAVCAMVLLVAAGAVLAQGTDDELLNVVLEGCRRSASSVVSGKGQVTVHLWMQKTQGGELEKETVYDYAFSAEKCRLGKTATFLKNDRPENTPKDVYVIPSGETTTSVITYDGEKITVQSPGDSSAIVSDLGNTTGKTVNGEISDVGIDGHALMAIDNAIQYAEPFTDGGMSIAGREEINGNECVIVETVHNADLGDSGMLKETAWFWVDVNRGYTVPLVRKWAEGGPYETKTLIAEVKAEVKNYGNDLWGPKKVTVDQFGIDPETGGYAKAVSVVTTYSDDFALNTEVTEQDLALTLPSGTKVKDEITEGRYTVP